MGMGILIDTTVVAGATTTVQAASGDWKMTLVIGILNLAFVALRLWQEERKNTNRNNKSNDGK